MLHIEKNRELAVIHNQISSKSRINNVRGKKIFLLICIHIFSAFFIFTPCFAKNITLNWDETNDPNIAGFMIYYRVGNGGAPYEGFGIIEGATVMGRWTLGKRALNRASNQTDSKGMATVDSKKAWAKSGSVFTFTVTGVLKEGYSYDPTSNIRTKDSIALP